MKPGSTAAVLAVLLAASTVADARSPGVWQRASDPQAAVAESLHHDFEKLLIQLRHLRSDPAMRQEKASDAMRNLEQAHAETSTHIGLRLDFALVAEILGEELESLEEWRRAAAAFQSVLAEAPDHPRAVNAFFQLGICFAKLRRAEEEIVAYDEFLARETDVNARATALYDRGDAHMLLAQHQPEQLQLALNDYRSALVLEPDLRPAHWGLAIALDRSGDAPGAIAQAKVALGYDPLEQYISKPLVFFVPEYDQYWYEALSAMARAEQVEVGPSVVLLWEIAVVKWSAFVALAESDDRWLPLAKAHLASSQRHLDEAKRRMRTKGRKFRGEDPTP